jgi:glutamyl-Q tRNA(Asp) synthetase
LGRMNGLEASTYTGRFAPSPTGALHAGSLVAALASWLDARAQGGKWLVRMEDVDGPRCVRGADQVILRQLVACGLHPDEPPVYQSQRNHLYWEAIDSLIKRRRAYPCGCTRQDIADALVAAGQPRQRYGELIYPGTCRSGLHGRNARAWRLLTENFEPNTVRAHEQRAHPAIESGADEPLSGDSLVTWHDRRLGPQSQDVGREVGDFVLRRADGLWAYQLAVVVDDAAQGITHVVRGEDLADNTARQIMLQRALGLPQPQYLHAPLVLESNGEKLSKQNGALPLDVSDPLAVLRDAGATLGVVVKGSTVADWLARAVNQWRLQICGAQSQSAT